MILPPEIRSCVRRNDRSGAQGGRRLLADNPVAGFSTLAELARAAGSSHPTALRCIRKPGFANCPDFRETLRGEMWQNNRTAWPRGISALRPRRERAEEVIEQLQAPPVYGTRTRSAPAPEAALTPSCQRAPGRVWPPSCTGDMMRTG